MNYNLYTKRAFYGDFNLLSVRNALKVYLFQSKNKYHILILVRYLFTFCAGVFGVFVSLR